MQNNPQLVGDDRDRVQNFHVGLLRQVVGDSLQVVGYLLGVVGDPLLAFEDILEWCLQKAIT